MLSAFYANYYSEHSFPHLISAIIEWEEYLIKQHDFKIFNFFIELEESEYRRRYHQSGRYETLEQCLEMQAKMKAWFEQYTQIFLIKNAECTPEYILKFVGVNL